MTRSPATEGRSNDPPSSLPPCWTAGQTGRHPSLAGRTHQDLGLRRSGEIRRNAMLITKAQIETERPSRYLVQFCKHAAAMGGSTGGHGPRVHLGGMLARSEVQVRAEWSDTHGTVTFTPWGQCTLQANVNTLSLCVEATDAENLRRIQDIVTRDLDRFSRRDPLMVSWHQLTASSVAAGEGVGGMTPAHTGKNHSTWGIPQPQDDRPRGSWRAGHCPAPRAGRSRAGELAMDRLGRRHCPGDRPAEGGPHHARRFRHSPSQSRQRRQRT